MNATAAIHVAKKQLRLDDDTYRDLLDRVTGKRSTADMSDQEREKVLAEFRRQGFKSAGTGTRRRLEGKFAGKLQALWIAGWNLGVVKNRDDAALIAFVKRQTNIDHVRFLRDADDAMKAIEALKGWLARKAGVDWSEGDLRPLWMQAPGARVAMAQWNMLAKASGAPADFEAFQRLVLETAGSALGSTTTAGWHLVTAALGERVRAAKP